MKRENATAGFAMLEVLITIMVVSVGLLALAGLQLTSLRGAQESAKRTIAVHAAYEMADRMKANSQQTYHLLSGTLPNCTGGACSATDLALFDTKVWQTRLAQELPGGVGVVCHDSTAIADGSSVATHGCDNAGDLGTYVIKIWWSERSSEPTASTSTEMQVFALEFRP